MADRKTKTRERMRCNGVLTVNSFGAVSYDPDRRSEPASGVNSLHDQERINFIQYSLINTETYLVSLWKTSAMGA